MEDLLPFLPKLLSFHQICTRTCAALHILTPDGQVVSISCDKYANIMHIYTQAEDSRPNLSWVSFHHATTPPSIIDYREDTEKTQGDNWC